MPAHQGTNISVKVPQGQGLWRLRVGCKEPITKLQYRRVNWSMSLRTHNLDWLADRVAPTIRYGEIVTPEMSR